MVVVRVSDIVVYLPCPVFGQCISDLLLDARVRDPESPGRGLPLAPSSLVTSAPRSTREITAYPATVTEWALTTSGLRRRRGRLLRC